jgi:hypothetical protein
MPVPTTYLKEGHLVSWAELEFIAAILRETSRTNKRQI